jgi:quercetin dioxygenase-like cupin family protein
VEPLHIRDTYVALDDVCEARPLPVTADFWNELRTGKLGDFSRMVSFTSFEGAWSSWEKHPAGEEVVMLIAGRVELALELAQGVSRVVLDRPGAYVLVPRDTWHTARALEPSQMLFITPGAGTRNKPA